jgi:hypothetical protein
MTDVEVFMHPSPKTFAAPDIDAPAIPDALKNAWSACIQAYNSGLYSPAAVAGRRTLEGIFKYLVPEERRNLPLAKLIEAAREQTDLTAPLTALSHAVRSGGNLGAHFDLEREPTEGVARQIVELVSYLISYLYVLPAQIELLESALNSAEEPGEPDS